MELYQFQTPRNVIINTYRMCYRYLLVTLKFLSDNVYLLNLDTNLELHEISLTK